MEKITPEDLGKILKKIRKEKEFTQKEIAEETQIDQSLISGWERGTRSPSLLNIYKLCQLFDMTIDELLGIEKKKYITLIISRDDIDRLHTTIREVEEALTFIFPTQDTTLHHKWAELKRMIELFLLNAE